MNYKSYHYNFLIVILGCILFSSCTAYKKLPYLDNLDPSATEKLLSDKGLYEPEIKPNDILSITVNSTIPGAASDFNLPLVPTNSTAVPTSVTGNTGGVSTTGSLQNYLVDKDGVISFPVLGSLPVAGMTIPQLKEYLAGLISPRYISSKPVVNAWILNYSVAVLGEVARPGTYKSENGQMTIFDALAAAGDLTLFGKRNNVLLLRTTPQGDVLTYRINLQDKNSFSDKNIFYLQQGDKLYVETNKARGNSSSIGSLETVSLSALSVIISIIAIVTR
jgi:polysaccharide biosynthesis/export protein